MCPSGNVGCATSFRSVQLSKIKVYGLRLSPAHLLTPQGLGRAADSVPLSAGGHMSPHVLKRGFSIPFLGKNSQTVFADIVHTPFFIGPKRISQIFSM